MGKEDEPHENEPDCSCNASDLSASDLSASDLSASDLRHLYAAESRRAAYVLRLVELSTIRGRERRSSSTFMLFRLVEYTWSSSIFFLFYPIVASFGPIICAW